MAGDDLDSPSRQRLSPSAITTQLLLPETAMLPLPPLLAPWTAPELSESLSPTRSPSGVAFGPASAQGPSRAGGHTPKSVPAAAAAVAAAAAALAAATRVASPAKPKETPQLEELKRKQERALSILGESHHVVGPEAERGRCTFAELETSTSKLEQVVQACRWQPQPMPPGAPDNPDCFFWGATSRADGQCGREELHENWPRLPLEGATSPGIADARIALEAEIRSLRVEVSSADERLKAVIAESRQISASVRRSADQHQQWMYKLQDEAAFVRKENQRLERSLHQASVEECRAAEVVRTQPAHADETFVKLRDECNTLEFENNKLAVELQSGRSELACMRGTHPHVEPKRGTTSTTTGTHSLNSSATSMTSMAQAKAAVINVARCGATGKSRAVTAVDRALARHGSLPNLRRAWI